MFNVIRSDIAPPSLADKKSWRGADVLKSLRESFHEKCYLCETKELTSINIEHFDSHQNDEDKKYDWDNLFYVCGRCNNIKGHHFNNLINCTDTNTDALRLIRHLPPHTPHSSSLTIEATNTDPKTIETVSLLKNIFMGNNTPNQSVAGAALRKKVCRKYTMLLTYINTYTDDLSTDKEKEDALDKMKVLMSKKQEYSAFLTWPILESPELLEILEPYID